MSSTKDDGTTEVRADIITPHDLGLVMPHCPSVRLTEYAHALSSAALEWQINTAQRLAAWLAQVALESGELRYWRELADGAAYEGRADLGNTQPGDGHRFVGRGIIQLTGRANYLACGRALGIDLLTSPESLEQSGPGARAGAWYWFSRKLSELADAGTPNAFREITRRINRAATDLAPSYHLRRVAYWERAKAVLGA